MAPTTPPHGARPAEPEFDQMVRELDALLAAPLEDEEPALEDLVLEKLAPEPAA